MRDALLTIRLPFERLYASLSGDQDWRLAREADARDVTGTVATAQARSQMCTEQAADIAGWPLQAIGRALQGDEQQRANLEMLRMRLAGMAQLVISSCPTYPLLGPWAGSPRCRSARCHAVCCEHDDAGAAELLRVAQRQAEGQPQQGHQTVQQALGASPRWLVTQAM